MVGASKPARKSRGGASTSINRPQGNTTAQGRWTEQNGDWCPEDQRLTLNRAGQVVLTLKTPYRAGTTHLVMSPLEFMQRLAALGPRPRLHLIRFHGVLAPNAKLRPAIIPSAVHLCSRFTISSRRRCLRPA